MKNKVLVEVVVPFLDESYNIYFPINRRIGNIICLINKALYEETYGVYTGSNTTALYDTSTGEVYDMNKLVRETNIKNGTKVVLY